MQAPRPVQQIPVLGQQQSQARAAIQQAIQQLSMGIYAQIASGHIATMDVHSDLDPRHLRRVAKDSVVAARCYFEGIGAIEQEQTSV